MRLFKQLFILASSWHLFNCWATISLVATVFLLVLQSLFYVTMLRLQAIILPDTCHTAHVLHNSHFKARLALENKKTVKELEKSLGSNLQKRIFHYLKKELGVLLNLWRSCDFQLNNTERLGKTSGLSAAGGGDKVWQGHCEHLYKEIWQQQEQNRCRPQAVGAREGSYSCSWARMCWRSQQQRDTVLGRGDGKHMQ